jgi:hypothetical protein
MPVDEIADALVNNMQKDFVQRIIHPETSPESVPWGEDQTASHQMAANEIDGRYLAYPEVVNIDGKLTPLNPQDAIIYALKNNEFIEFPTQEKATEFSKNYKKFWK